MSAGAGCCTEVAGTTALENHAVCDTRYAPPTSSPSATAVSATNSVPRRRPVVRRPLMVGLIRGGATWSDMPEGGGRGSGSSSASSAVSVSRLLNRASQSVSGSAGALPPGRAGIRAQAWPRARGTTLSARHRLNSRYRPGRVHTGLLSWVRFLWIVPLHPGPGSAGEAIIAAPCPGPDAFHIRTEAGSDGHPVRDFATLDCEP